VAVGRRRAAVQLIGGSEVLWVALGMAEEATPAASSMAAVADGVGLRPEQGGDDLIGNERRGRPGLAVRRPRPREPVRTAACPRPARQTDAADGPPGRARFARAARGTRHLGMRATWGRVHVLGKARLGKERRGPEAEVAGHGTRARGGARERRATSRSGFACCGLPWFDSNFLLNFELKCTIWSTGKL
jgi:hypothetical protein